MTDKASPLDTLWRARYGADASAPSLPSQGVDVLQHLFAHRSVRAYRDAPLPEDTLPLLVAAAQSASSSSNLQAWSVVAVRDAERKARLAEWTGGQAHVRQAPLFLVWIADLSRLQRVTERREAPADALRYTEMFLVAAVDAALAAQNAAVAAEALGLGTVYIGAVRNHADRVADELGLPPQAFPLFGLCVGFEDTSKPLSAVKPRLPQSAVLHEERYRSDDDAADVHAYDETMQAFQRDNALRPVAWSQQASQRVAGPGSLTGRHVLREWLEARGFARE